MTVVSVLQRRVGGHWDRCEVFGVSLNEALSSADLGDGLVDPKRQGCSAYAGFASPLEREWG